MSSAAVVIGLKALTYWDLVSQKSGSANPEDAAERNIQ